MALRRIATPLVLAGVAALLVAAAVEALRGDPDARPAGLQTSAPSGVGSGLAGVLYYTDASCDLQALRFPALRPERAPRWDECTFSLAPRGGSVGTGASTWAPRGDRSASESDGRIILSESGSSGPAGQSASFAGSAPAFRPDGSLSFFRDGALRELDPGCIPLREPPELVEEARVDRCSQVLLRPADLRRVALLHPSAPDDPRPGLLRRVTVKAQAWLDEERRVLLVQLDVLAAGRFEEIVILEGGRVVDLEPASGGRLTGLEVSPRGRYFAVLTEDPDGVLLFERDGTGLPLPPLTRPRAVAWSPGERWTALATRASVYVFRTGASSPLVRRLGLRAGDIAWRPN
jgi:hypothetical protein